MSVDIGMLFAFAGRVSTEDLQDPRASHNWQVSRARQLIGGHGRRRGRRFRRRHVRAEVRWRPTIARRPWRCRQVVIDVADLSQDECRQIFYNHVRLGDQPPQVRAALKPYLRDAAIATRSGRKLPGVSAGSPTPKAGPSPVTMSRTSWAIPASSCVMSTRAWNQIRSAPWR
jgi:hypothetical protein